MIDGDAMPLINSGFRLQWEPAQESHVLLYPEGMVVLSGPAAEILKRCDGASSVARILAALQEEFDGENIEHDVRSFLDAALAQGWISMATGE